MRSFTQSIGRKLPKDRRLSCIGVEYFKGRANPIALVSSGRLAFQHSHLPPKMEPLAGTQTRMVNRRRDDGARPEDEVARIGVTDQVSIVISEHDIDMTRLPSRIGAGIGDIHLRRLTGGNRDHNESVFL